MCVRVCVCNALCSPFRLAALWHMSKVACVQVKSFSLPPCASVCATVCACVTSKHARECVHVCGCVLMCVCVCVCVPCATLTGRSCSRQRRTQYAPCVTTSSLSSQMWWSLRRACRTSQRTSSPRQASQPSDVSGRLTTIVLPGRAERPSCTGECCATLGMSQFVCLLTNFDCVVIRRVFACAP